VSRLSLPVLPSAVPARATRIAPWAVLHVSVPIPLPEQLVEDLNKREEGLPVAPPPPPPPLPSPAFHFNQHVVACVASEQSLSEEEQLRLRLQDLEAQLASTSGNMTLWLKGCRRHDRKSMVSSKLAFLSPYIPLHIGFLPL